MTHIFLHFLVPGLIAAIWWRKQWLPVFILLMSSLLIDLDHLLANPIYDPERCSIGFHPLHSGWAMLVYGLLLLVTFRLPASVWVYRTRWVLIGVFIHLLLDGADCLF